VYHAVADSNKYGQKAAGMKLQLVLCLVEWIWLADFHYRKSQDPTSANPLN
jgi:hypothetical protein